jgi:uncharacterized membrane protein YecN with MAPEG domain
MKHLLVILLCSGLALAQELPSGGKVQVEQPLSSQNRLFVVASGMVGTEHPQRKDLCSDGQYPHFGRVESSNANNNLYAPTSFLLLKHNNANAVENWQVFAVGDVATILNVSNGRVLYQHLLSDFEHVSRKAPFFNGKELGARGHSNLCQ